MPRKRPEAPTSGPRLLKIDEVAAELRMSRATVYRLINSGKLATVHVGNGGFIRVKRTDLTAYIAKYRRPATDAAVEEAAKDSDAA